MLAALHCWLRGWIARNILAPDPHDPPYPKGFQMPQLHGVTVPEADMVDVESMTCLLLAATPDDERTALAKRRAVLCAVRTLNHWRVELDLIRRGYCEADRPASRRLVEMG